MSRPRFESREDRIAFNERFVLGVYAWCAMCMVVALVVAAMLWLAP